MKIIQRSNLDEARQASIAEGRSPYLLWLVWVVWLPLIIPSIIKLFQDHPPLPLLIVTLVGLVLFFGIYLWAAWRRAQLFVATSSLPRHTAASTWLVIAVLSVLSLILTLLTGNEWQSLLFYTSGYVGGGRLRQVGNCMPPGKRLHA